LKAFRTDDGYLLFFRDGKWTDGDQDFFDVAGQPMNFDGRPLGGMPIEVKVLDKTEWCCDHGTSVEYNTHASYWHPISFRKTFTEAVKEFVSQVNRFHTDSDPTKYRIQTCQCCDVFTELHCEPLEAC